MKDNFIKIAVLGLGYMGQNHLRVISKSPEVKLVAICDIDLEKTKKLAKIYKVKAYKDYKKLIKNEDLDAIFICLPTSLHFKTASFAINKDIAVFIEKPISATTQQARKLIKAAGLKKTPIMIGHIERFNPVVNEIKQRIASGELGKIIHIHTQRFSPPPARAQDVSAIVDLATHDIDIIKYILGQDPIRIYSEAENKYHQKEDLMSALIRFTDGAIGLVEVSWLHPTKIRNLTVVGQNGMYVANYLTQELFFYKQNDNKLKTESLSPSSTWADVIKIGFEAKEPLQIELEAFIKALKSKSKMPITPEEGLAALEMTSKMEKSSISHKVIR